jgi:hypothetical protein
MKRTERLTQAIVDKAMPKRLRTPGEQRPIRGSVAPVSPAPAAPAPSSPVPRPRGAPRHEAAQRPLREPGGVCHLGEPGRLRYTEWPRPAPSC